MKIQILSDLHLGHSYWPLPPTDADVIVLAGDITEGVRGIQWAAGEAEDLDVDVVYVLGNHEHYNRDYGELIAKAREAAAGTRVHLLERDALVLGDVRFLGCTLWTDFLLYGPDYEQTCLKQVGACLTDFAVIRYEGRPFRPEDTQQIHRQSRAWLEQQLAQPWDEKTVVVTHHAPLLAAGNPLFEGGRTTAGFVSDLTPLFDLNKIDLWVSGHTHANVDEMIGRTRLVSNQRGYPYERIPGPEFDPKKVVEV